MIIAGASAYARIIDFAPFAEVAKEIGATVHGGHGALRGARRHRAIIRRPCRSPMS